MQKLILASGSPRRKEILGLFEVPFEIITSEIEEIVREEDSPEVAVMSLAFEKAYDVASGSPEGAIVIGADTLVYCDGFMGKPKDEEDARRMLGALQGRNHQVYTGIAVLRAGTHEKVADAVCTTVHIRPLDEKQIQSYIDSGEVWGKAGAYAIQGRGSVIVDRIEGDYFNVVGLPIGRVYEILRKHFGLELL